MRRADGMPLDFLTCQGPSGCKAPHQSWRTLQDGRHAQQQEGHTLQLDRLGGMPPRRPADSAVKTRSFEVSTKTSGIEPARLLNSARRHEATTPVDRKVRSKGPIEGFKSSIKRVGTCGGGCGIVTSMRKGTPGMCSQLLKF